MADRNPKNKSIQIEINEPQPLPCTKCGEFEGYQYYDSYRMSYISIHNSDGKYNGGQYNDGNRLNKGKLAYCANCGERLSFKLKRKDNESVD